MFDAVVVRTTLEIADDVLQAARSIAQQQGTSLGDVISSLARAGLRPQGPPSSLRNGVPLLSLPDSAFVSPDLALVNQLRDETP